jgi:SAM-dependent methyltransferase
MYVALFEGLLRVRPLRKVLFRQWYDYFATRCRSEDVTFMNHGYVDPKGAPLPLDPGDEPNRCTIQLYHRVAEAAEPRGRDVLEVGSGCGGGASYVARYLGPKSVTGVDLSTKAVEFSRARHRVRGLRFLHGDAEQLPFDGESFDVVLNVESSHCYPSMRRFLSEARRVLRPGGHFAHADARRGSELAAWRRDLEGARFELLAEDDITRGVLASFEMDNERKRERIRRLAPPFLVDSLMQAAGLRGSRTYEALASRRLVYLSFLLRKRG